MGYFSRKTILALVAVIAGASAAFMTAGAAGAATAAPSAAAKTVSVTALAVPQAPAALSWPLVVQGDKGERVVAIQYLLNQRIGAGLKVDGVFGPLTAAAVRNFQSRFHLQVDGKVGSQTWTQLVIEVQRGSSGAAVMAVQHNLRFAYGFTSLAVDGIFGPATQTAVRSFQAKFKIGVDGIVGPITWNALVVHES